MNGAGTALALDGALTIAAILLVAMVGMVFRGTIHLKAQGDILKRLHHHARRLSHPRS
jgi:hypothetical protein